MPLFSLPTNTIINNNGLTNRVFDRPFDCRRVLLSRQGSSTAFCPVKSFTPLLGLEDLLSSVHSQVW